MPSTLDTKRGLWTFSRTNINNSIRFHRQITSDWVRWRRVFAMALVIEEAGKKLISRRSLKFMDILSSFNYGNWRGHFRHGADTSQSGLRHFGRSLFGRVRKSIGTISIEHWKRREKWHQKSGQSLTWRETERLYGWRVIKSRNFINHRAGGATSEQKNVSGVNK